MFCKFSKIEIKRKNINVYKIQVLKGNNNMKTKRELEAAATVLSPVVG